MNLTAGQFRPHKIPIVITSATATACDLAICPIRKVTRRCCPVESIEAQGRASKTQNLFIDNPDPRTASLRQPQCCSFHGHQAGTIDLAGFNRFMGLYHLVEFKPGADMMAQFTGAE